MRAALALAIGLALASSAALAAGAGAPAVQFIDKSYVSLPKALGAYTLQRLDYTNKHPEVGATGHYSARNAPAKLTLSVSVYPEGRAEEAVAVEQQLGTAQAVINAQADFTEVKPGASSALDVAAPAPTLTSKAGYKQPILIGRPTKVDPKEAAARAAREPSLEQTLKTEMTMPALSHGRRQDYAYLDKGTPMRAAVITFYRQLYDIKVRVAVPAADMPQADFDAFVTTAAKTLVPKVDIRNFGACGSPTIFSQDSGDEKRDKEAGTRTLIRAKAQALRDNCAQSELAPEPPIAGYERAEIVFPAGAWKDAAPQPPET